MLLIGHGYDAAEIKKRMLRSLTGEITIIEDNGDIDGRYKSEFNNI